MTKDRYERRTYRKSPGRQYGYDYDPLRSQRTGASQSGRLDASTTGDPWLSRGETHNRSSGQLAQRPDPRRTRQLLRQSILAGKSRSTALHEVETEQQDNALSAEQPLTGDDQYMDEGQEDSTLFRNRYRLRDPRPAQAAMPEQQQYVETNEGDWNDFDFVDPDIGYEDPLDQRVKYAQTPRAGTSPAPTDRRMPEEYQRGSRRGDPEEYQRGSRRGDPEEYEEDEYEYDDEPMDQERPVRRKAKKRGVTRRKLLVGLGLAAAGGVAAYELAPRIPQAIQDVGTNIEHQLQDAYNKGLLAGEEAIRKEFVTSLENLEGVSLQAAIRAARLTRLAYDAFVSPLVTLAATVTGDFLGVTLQAIRTARGFLVKFNQDNDTLLALQTVIETWIKKIKELPKEIQTIADADLDGAQAYLRALQRKIDDEKAKLNSPPTPSPSPTPKATTKPKH